MVSDMNTTILALLDKAVAGLEARGDYSSIKFQLSGSAQSVTAANAVQSYLGLKQEVLLQQAHGIPIAAFSIGQVIDVTDAIIVSNVAMQKMGPLNTNRTMAPSAAAESNATFKSLLDELLKFKATNQTGAIAPSPAQLIYGPKGT
jgi:hypothetical protein